MLSLFELLALRFHPKAGFLKRCYVCYCMFPGKAAAGLNFHLFAPGSQIVVYFPVETNVDSVAPAPTGTKPN